MIYSHVHILTFITMFMLKWKCARVRTRRRL